MNKKIKFPFILFFTFIFLQCSSANPDVEPIIIDNNEEVSSHPYLLLLAGEERQLYANIQKDTYWTRVHNAIITSCDALLNEPPMQRVFTGKRLLPVSREVLRRVFYLSYAYRTTSKPNYAIRAEEELLAAANFTDWNPAHFLDVAEMTMAMAIGYDWLYNYLKESSRVTIRNAIRDKGLIPSENSAFYGGFISTKTNWGQVCHGSLACGALVIQDDEPALAARILARSKERIKLPMSAYDPHGAYPEGIGYWEYGTSFNMLYISAMEKYYGEVYSFTGYEAFLSTGEYSQQMIAPSLKSYCYMDNSSSVTVSPTSFWFFNKTQNNIIPFVQRKVLDNSTDAKITKERLLPAMVLWGVGTGINPAASLNNVSIPQTHKYYYAEGPNPVCVMRTSWSDNNSLFVGLKGGTPGYNHGHMDIGSFMMEANGIRWAIDFGHQDYTSAEEGMGDTNFWNRTQDSPRWDLTRLGNHGHNTLIVNNQRQLVNGNGTFIAHSDNADNMNVVCDMTSVYNNALGSAKRGIALIQQKYVVVEDLITVKYCDSPTIRWNMTTEATSISINQSKNKITLTSSNGKKLYLKVLSPIPVQLKTWSTTPKNSFETSNEGTTFVGFECQPNGTTRIKVLLMPGTEYDVTPDDLIQ